MTYIKYFILFFFITVTSFAQTEYKTTQGITYKVGDTLQIGQPIGISLSAGRWKTIFSKSGNEITNNNLINKKTFIKKIKIVDGIAQFYFRIYATDFYVNIDEGLAKGEIISPYNKLNALPDEEDKYDKLKKIKDLLDSGALTKEEYNSEKIKILNLPK